MADRAEGPTAYHLVLFTRSDDGIWAFNEGVARAWVNLYTETWQPPPADTLFGPSRTAPPSPHPILGDELAAHLRAVAGSGRELIAARDIRDVFGPTLGRAGQRHLREAIKKLRADGVLAGEPPTGDLHAYRIVASKGRGISS